jgi:hypothetical protein
MEINEHDCSNKTLFTKIGRNDTKMTLTAAVFPVPLLLSTYFFSFLGTLDAKLAGPQVQAPGQC